MDDNEYSIVAEPSTSTYVGDCHVDIDPDIDFISKTVKECKYYTDDLLCNTLSKRKGLSISHFNIRSLNANFKTLDIYLSQLNFKFDIIAISETWFNQNTVVDVLILVAII